MSTITIKPSNTLAGAGNYAIGGGAGSLYAAVSDGSDSTYIRVDTTTPWAGIRFHLNNPTIPADEFVTAIVPYLRLSGTNGRAQKLSLIAPSEVGIVSESDVFSSHATATKQTFPVYASRELITTDWLNGLVLRHSSSDISSYSARAYLYEMGVDIYTNKVATGSTGARTETATAYPSVPVEVVTTIDSAATESDRWHVIFVDVESGGTTHGTGTLVASRALLKQYPYTDGSEDTYSEVVTLDTALPAGSYKAYARVLRSRRVGPELQGIKSFADELGSGYIDALTASKFAAVADSAQFSAWSAAATITMNLEIPAAPTIALTADQSYDRVAVAVTPVATDDYSSPVIEVQRSDDGVTWTTVRGMEAVSGGTFGSPKDCGYDYEAVRGVAVSYRARITALFAGVPITGDWCAESEVTIAAEGWVLKAPQVVTADFHTSAYNLIDCRVIGDVPESVSEDVGIFRAVGRKYPIVVAGTLYGRDGSLTIATSTAAEWTRLQTLLESQEPMLLQSPFGWQKWIRGASSVESQLSGTPTAPRRLAGLSYVEVEAP